MSVHDFRWMDADDGRMSPDTERKLIVQFLRRMAEQYGDYATANDALNRAAVAIMTGKHLDRV